MKVTAKPLNLLDYDELYYPTPTNNSDDRANGSGFCIKIVTFMRNGEQCSMKVPIGKARVKPDQIAFSTK